MRKFLPALLFLFAIKANSQSVVLTQSANEAIIGDTSTVHVLDTTNFASGMPIGTTGTNVIWNFTNLITTTAVVTSAYVSTTAVSGASAYPGSNYVQKQGTLYTYFKSVTSPTTQTEFLGIGSSSLSMNFSSNSAIGVVYPMGLGNSVADNFSGSFSFSISGTVNGNVTTTADGSGTLNLMDGISLTNVLRVKSVQNMTLTSGPFPVGTIKQTTYNFYHATEKFAILTLNYTSIALTGQSPTVTAGATGNKNVFVVGVKENSLADAQLSVYPNPVKDLLTVNTASAFNAKKIMIYTQLGQCIYSTSYESTIDVKNLAKGIYFVEISGDKGTVRKKFIKD
jgi:hypothetical protein